MAPGRVRLRLMDLHPEVPTHVAVRPYGHHASREEARARLAAILQPEDTDDLVRLDAEVDRLLLPAGDRLRSTETVREAVVPWAPRS